MLEILRKSPLLRLEGNKTVTLKNVRPPAKTLALSAEAMIPNGAEKPVAFVFGPENGAVTETLVQAAAKEANGSPGSAWRSRQTTANVPGVHDRWCRRQDSNLHSLEGRGF